MNNKVDCGALFKNERKENPKQPDYTGSININGKERRISMWVKVSKNGVKYLSLSLGGNMMTLERRDDKKQDIKIEPMIDDALPW